MDIKGMLELGIMREDNRGIIYIDSVDLSERLRTIAVECSSLKNIQRRALPSISSVNEYNVFKPSFSDSYDDKVSIIIYSTTRDLKAAVINEMREADAVFVMAYMITDKDYISSLRGKMACVVLGKHYKGLAGIDQINPIEIGRIYKNLPFVLYEASPGYTEFKPFTKLDIVRKVGSAYVSSYGGVLHSKTIVFCKQIGSVLVPYCITLGSSNLTKNSLNCYETSSMVWSKKLACKVLDTIMWAEMISVPGSSGDDAVPNIVIIDKGGRLSSTKDFFSMRSEVLDAE